MLPLLVLVYCYSCIVSVIREKANVNTGINSTLIAIHERHVRIPKYFIKTMIIITVLYSVSWTTNEITYFMLNEHSLFADSFERLSATVFTAYINVCVNPFIHATQYDVVKTLLKFCFSCLATRQPNSIQTAALNMGVLRKMFSYFKCVNNV